MWYTLLADAIVAVHLAFVLFIILGQLTFVVGAIRRWEWVRNFWLRLGHLVSIFIVAAESVLGIECPLTVWEDAARRAAGQTVTDGTFIGRLSHDLLFYQAPNENIFTICYVTFAAVVLLTFVLAPPRWRRSPTTLACEPAVS